MAENKKDQVLVFLKPDCTMRRPVSAKILKEFVENDFKIRAFKEVKVNRALAEQHYQEHKGKFFYPWLVKMITLSPVIAMIIEDTPNRIREFIGNTFCHEAEKGTIRGEYGIWGGVNSVHASDSYKSARRELNLWKEFVNLVPSQSDVVKEINNYIKKWDNKIESDLKEIRNICENIKALPEKVDEFKEKLRENLIKDCKKSEKKIKKSIDKFVNTIVENCLL
ncbi:MAG: hypothetical protein GF329_21940 [Candidatus Lokiarchaeota archaeon]|nr:hypothetical protein [Candidatus Lokiarchaeota archaeon]